MKIICPTCDTSYHIDSAKIPATKFKAKCPKCESKFIVDPNDRPTNESDQTNTGVDQGHAENGNGLGIEPENGLENGTHDLEPHQEQEQEPVTSVVDDYPELAELSSATYRLESIFASGKGKSFKNRHNSRKVKILSAVAPVLKNLLQEGEEVFKIARGALYYPLEIPYANGILTLPYNYFAILCTNTRILFINIDPLIRRPTRYLYQMPYEGIKKVKKGLLFSSLIFCRNKGGCRNFTSMGHSAARELHDFIAARVTEVQSTKYLEDMPEHICPECLQPTYDYLEQCPHCRVQYKDPRQAMLKSLALPGWGALYLGHKGLGILEMTGSLLVWIIIFSLIFSKTPWNFTISFMILLVYNGTDSVLTYFLGRKGYLIETNTQKTPPAPD